MRLNFNTILREITFSVYSNNSLTRLYYDNWISIITFVMARYQWFNGFFIYLFIYFLNSEFNPDVVAILSTPENATQSKTSASQTEISEENSHCEQISVFNPFQKEILTYLIEGFKVSIVSKWMKWGMFMPTNGVEGFLFSLLTLLHIPPPPLSHIHVPPASLWPSPHRCLCLWALHRYMFFG